MRLTTLTTELYNVKDGEYSWTLYFFNILGKGENYDIEFYKCDCADNITNDLKNDIIDNIINRVFKKLAPETQDYSAGTNPKISLIELELTSDVVKNNYTKFADKIDQALTNSSSNKFTGYMLKGHPKQYYNNDRDILLINKTNPIVKAVKTRTFPKLMDLSIKQTNEGAYLFRFYASIDCFVIGSKLYSNNLDFESIFELESTLKIKIAQNIERINAKKCINEFFKGYLAGLKSGEKRSLFTVQETYLSMMDHEETLIKFCSDYGFDYCDGKIVINNEESAKKLYETLARKATVDAAGHRLIGNNLSIVD